MAPKSPTWASNGHNSVRDEQPKRRMRAFDQPQSRPEQPKRKVFQCIVDDTALVLGVKKSTRDGIRKWVSQNAIRLYVPLHTLQQLERLKHSSDRIGVEAREAIKWLDDITSMPAVVASGSVQLEGVDEQYESWEEVEHFLLPDTLLSLENAEAEITYEDDLEESFAHMDVSDELSMSSSHSLEEPPKTPQSATSMFSEDGANKALEGHLNPKAAALMMNSPDRTARNSAELSRKENLKASKHAVPDYLKPLFNHILWRIHKERNPNAALESFILLTNDDTKQSIARKFGIRAKRLEQMRDAIGHEDREYKNRLTYLRLESGERKPHAIVAPYEDRLTQRDRSNDKSESENRTPRRPKSSHACEGTPASRHSIDEEGDVEDSDAEDEVLFKRAPKGPQSQQSPNQKSLESNTNGASQQQGSRGGRGRGGRGGHTSRARGVFTPRARGGFSPRGAYTPPGQQNRANNTPRTIDPNQPIDPDSFSRPNIRGSSTRGNSRRLWEPN